MKDYYKILGVDKIASMEEIKKSYRKLAVEYHPDKHKGDKIKEEKFKEISEAYDVLKDKQKRNEYDMFNASYHQPFRGSSGFDFNDIFSTIREKRESNIKYSANVKVTLEDIYFEKEIARDLVEDETCDSCSGKGFNKSEDNEVCHVCNGKGVSDTNINSFFVMQSTCENCDGAGKIIKNKCKKCDGLKSVKKEKKMKFKLPGFIGSGDRLNLGRYIFNVIVEPHNHFHVDNRNIIYTHEIPFTFAMLGGEIEVPSIAGNKLKLKINEAIQEDTVLKIKGKGLKDEHDNYHDMFIKFKILYPKKTSEKQKKILKEFEKNYQ